MRLTVTGPGGQTFTLTNAAGRIADVQFTNRADQIETIVVNSSATSSVVSSPYAGNLRFGELEIGADIEGNPVYARPGFSFNNLAGVTKVVIKAKCDGSLTLNYDNVLSSEEVVYDSSWPPESDSDGNTVYYNLPLAGQVKTFTRTHSNEQYSSPGSCRINYRITVYTASTSWSSSASTTPSDYARFGGGFGGGV
jgi:hypothetical protein